MTKSRMRSEIWEIEVEFYPEFMRPPMTYRDTFPVGMTSKEVAQEVVDGGIFTRYIDYPGSDIERLFVKRVS